MLGWTTLRTFSNSARVMTLLQSDGVALDPGGLSHSPCTVITGLSGATVDAGEPVVCPSVVLGRGFSWGTSVWPIAQPTNRRYTQPLRLIVKNSSLIWPLIRKS